MYMKIKNLDSKVLLILQIIIVGSLVYSFSNSLREFSDEIVSLSSNISFWNNNLEFKANSGEYSSYNPKLTSGPISAIGSSLGWNFTSNLNELRIFNFIYVYIVQLLFCFVISIKYKFDFTKLLIICGFVLTSIPWWYGTLYSLGEMISAILFFNSAILFNYYRKTSLVFMSIAIFFGKFILIICFFGFYFSVFINEKKFSKALKDAIYFLTPLFFWIILVLSKSDFSLLSYFTRFYYVYFQQTDLTGTLNLAPTNIIENLTTSEVSSWNISVVLRVLICPIFAGVILIRHKIFSEMIDKHLFFSMLSIYLYFWLLNPKKSVIYSQNFLYLILLVTLISLFFTDLKNNIFLYSLHFFVIAIFMSSTHLFIILLIFLIFTLLTQINRKNLQRLLLFFLIISQANLFSESLNQEKYEFTIDECIASFSINFCNSDGYK